VNHKVDVIKHTLTNVLISPARPNLVSPEHTLHVRTRPAIAPPEPPPVSHEGLVVGLCVCGGGSEKGGRERVFAGIGVDAEGRRSEARERERDGGELLESKVFRI